MAIDRLSGWERDNTLLGVNQQIAELLAPALPGKRKFTSWAPPIVVSCAVANQTTQLPSNNVKNAIIQNISQLPVTLVGSNGGTGFILNGASAAANAGDAVTVGPQGNDDALDLSQIFFTTNQTGNVLSVLILA